MKNLKFDARRGTSVPYDSPTPGLTRQLQRLVTEERPGACVGCGYENSCSTRGCAVLREISRIVAVAEGGTEDDARLDRSLDRRRCHRRWLCRGVHLWPGRGSAAGSQAAVPGAADLHGA